MRGWVRGSFDTGTNSITNIPHSVCLHGKGHHSMVSLFHFISLAQYGSKKKQCEGPTEYELGWSKRICTHSV